MNPENTWRTPAKINLFLRITGRRADGMHELQTAFQFIELFDELRFIPRQDQRILRTRQSPVPYEQDLCIQAARRLQALARKPCGVDIELTKRIPMGGGLGGASSDAAATLLVLNQLWGLDLPRNELVQIGCQLGADVPVFIQGEAAWAEGIGEVLTPIDIDEHWYLIIDPGVHVATGEMFAHSQLTRHSPALTICPPKAGQYENVFEPLVRLHYPKVDSAFKWLSNYAQPFLTGTGACVVACCADKHSAFEIQSLCPEGLTAYVAKGCNTSPLKAQLDGWLKGD